jgi:hypothetical protein
VVWDRARERYWPEPTEDEPKPRNPWRKNHTKLFWVYFLVAPEDRESVPEGGSSG